MSSFSGKIKEFPQISVDRFDGRNLASTAYFLSHAHSDHMIGLSSPQFLDHLESNSGVYLYCSPITARFLHASIRHRPLSPYICPLQPEESVKITIPNVAEEAAHHLWVTLIPAAHCPGSVMFLFEGRGGNVLYTGDFRISSGEAARLNPLHNADGTVKLIDSLHIDTTFCHRDVMHFPGREESAQAIGDLVEDWLARGNNFLIHLICPAKYGYEYIYRSLNERFGMKIHVSRWKYRMYDTVPEIQDLLTLDATVTWIHACDWRMNNGEDIESSTNKQLPCRCVPFGVDSTPNIRLIKPSALFYIMYQSAKEIKQINHDGTFCRVLLSMHASCSEVLDLVSYLRPRKVFPNVIPFNSTKEEVLKLLHEALNRSGDHYSIEYGGSHRSSLGSFKRQLQSSDSACNGGSSCSRSSSILDAGLLDVYLSSPNKRRRHSDSNMTLVLPTPRGNMKGSLSLEGESRQHVLSKAAQPSTSSNSGAPTSSLPTVTDSSEEVGSTELEWKDPYSPSPTKSSSFFQSSDTIYQDTKNSSTQINSAKRNYSDMVDSLEIVGPSESSVKTLAVNGNGRTKKRLLSSTRSISEGDEMETESKISLKTEGSLDSIELNSVFSEDGERDPIIDIPNHNRSTSADMHGESSIKQSRKMWYKHKYFSTPVHDEIERSHQLESKPSIGPRSSSLPLPEVHREVVVSPDLFNSTDGESELNLPLITVSSPSDQASESQISDETNVTVVLSSGDPSDSDLLLIEDIPQDIVSMDDNAIDSNINNGVTKTVAVSTVRPSVICSPSKPDAASNVEIIEINSQDEDVVSTNVEIIEKIIPVPNLKERTVKWYDPDDWIDCNKVKRMTPLESNCYSKNNDVTLTLVNCGNLSNAFKVNSDSFINKPPEVVELLSDSDCSPDFNELIYKSNKQLTDVVPTSSRSSCLKTIRRTRDQVEVVSLDHQPL